MLKYMVSHKPSCTCIDSFQHSTLQISDLRNVFCYSQQVYVKSTFPQGIQGDQGLIGPLGPRGPPGFAGPKGMTGETGLVGAQVQWNPSYS